MIKAVPSENHLSRLYFELSRLGASSVGKKCAWPYRPAGKEELFCLACDLSRYDPRLVTILVRFLATQWGTLNPLSLRSFYPLMQNNQTVAVMAEFVLKCRLANQEIGYFCEYLQKGSKPVPLQFYFHHLYTPAGALAQRAIEAPLAEYKKWGFLACEAPILDEKSRTQGGSFDRAARLNILKNLLVTNKVIRIADYLAALNGPTLSRQQALLDIKSLKGMKAIGHGRGARWVERRGYS